MPIWLPAAITAGAGLLGQGANWAATSNMNKKNRAWSEHMYGKQLQDNYNQWTIQNQYNSPSNQMGLLKNAGLNPNLVYGHSSGGGSQAAPIKTPDVQRFESRSPEFNLGDVASRSFSTYFDTQIKQAQYDNLKEQKTLIGEDIVYRQAQTANAIADVKRKGFDLNLDSEVRDYTVEGKRIDVQKKRADLDYTLHEDARKALMNTQNLNESAARIAKMQIDTGKSMAEVARIYEDIKRIKQDTRLKNYEADLAKEGIYRHDPLWLRSIIQYLKSTYPIIFK